VAASDEHCGRSLWCRDYGLCRATEGGRCTAVLDRDCAGASVCRDRGLCFARGGVCVSAAVEGQHSRPLDAMRAPADDPGCSDCPKERYSPGMMAAGIALSGLSGVGLVMGFLFSKPFSLADSSPRAGYILWGVAGGLALLGIPLAIAGAHKVERKKSGARAEHERDGAHVRAIPRIAVGIMSSTFTWSF
jgi:hypothetical protein